ncbi:lipopolysaccharide biosynthesis protein [Exiguobacterium aestuarii]|uniref:lipopolysaccharide biosynthesis protein n=1 Tax=Exiguobacterium aestuarii TaxID=273527 RepID=UPI001CD33E4A|nr:oligosaccharide flippase family protein [Exiguobacterium aestuarii]MCA0981204.1 oligosaccharide flippase family protein [Exiguobacterium aestuarii]
MKTNNLFKKFLTYSYGSFIGLLIGFLTTMVSTRLLNPTEFGKSSIFVLVINILMILVIIGTDQTFMRFYYEEKEDKRGGLLYNVIKIPLLLSLLFSILILCFYKEISEVLFGEINIQLILILIIGYFSQFILRFGNVVIRMNQRGNLFSIIEVLKRLLQLILLIIMYFVFGASYKIVVYSTVLTFFILSIISILLEKKFWSLNGLKITNLKHNKFEIVRYSYPLAITVLITWLFQSFDQMAIRQWSSFEELGLYSAAFKIIALLTVVQVAFSTFWTPVCYEKFENNYNDKHFFTLTTSVVSLFMFSVSIVVIMLKDYIVLLLGADFYDASKIIPYLVFIPLMYTISETTVMGINFYKKPKWHVLIALLSLGVSVILNIILVPNYGGVGAAIGTAISHIIFFTLRTLISLKYYKVDYKLNKIFTMIVLVFSYALLSLDDSIQHITLGMIILFLNIIIYRKDIIKVYKKNISRSLTNS